VGGELPHRSRPPWRDRGDPEAALSCHCSLSGKRAGMGPPGERTGRPEAREFPQRARPVQPSVGLDRQILKPSSKARRRLSDRACVTKVRPPGGSRPHGTVEFGVRAGQKPRLPLPASPSAATSSANPHARARTTLMMVDADAMLPALREPSVSTALRTGESALGEPLPTTRSNVENPYLV
jgi:hypothetical protein